MNTMLPRPSAGLGQQQLLACQLLQPRTSAVASCSGAAVHSDALRLRAQAQPSRHRPAHTMRCSRRHRTACSAAFQPFPFDEDDYYKVDLQVVIEAARPVSSGNLLLMRDSDKQLGPDAEALVLAVGGDTLFGIAALVANHSIGRPMALDLMWQILERGQEISKRDWRLARVAIVDLQQQTYIGRLFFGDADSGAVVWDCDCRPSDGCWLALKTKCPLYVRKAVWEEHSTPMRELGRKTPEEVRSVAAVEDPSSVTTLLKIRGDEPEPVKRLKREMGVAIAEEDYAAAARIRDHPYLQLYRRILEHRQAARMDAARSMEKELEELINNEGGSVDRPSDI